LRLFLLCGKVSDVRCWNFVNKAIAAQDEAITSKQWYQPGVNSNTVINAKRAKSQYCGVGELVLLLR